MGDIKVMVDGGKANAGPPLGPALAPLGVNIGDVVAKINEKTEAFSGMKVPVVVTINSNKSFDIKVGLPPMSALIKKEVNAPKGAANPKTDVVGNLTMEQVLKVADMKDDVLNSYNKKAAAKEAAKKMRSEADKKAAKIEKEAATKADGVVNKAKTESGNLNRTAKQQGDKLIEKAKNS